MAPVGVIESSRNSAAASAGAGEPKKAKRLPPNAAMAAGTTGEFTLASYRKTGVGQAGSRAGQGLGAGAGSADVATEGGVLTIEGADNEGRKKGLDGTAILLSNVLRSRCPSRARAEGL